MFSPMFMKLMADAHIDDLRRAAARAGRQRDATPPAAITEAADVAITIRRALPGDGVALERLAALDSGRVPAEPVLLAEANGQLRAALSLSDGAALADPFHPAAETVQLLIARAAQLRGKPRQSGVSRLLPSVSARKRRLLTKPTRPI